MSPPGRITSTSGAKCESYGSEAPPCNRRGRADYGGRSVVFSGDTRQSDNLIEASKGVDVLVHEVAWAPPDLVAKSEPARNVIGLHTTPRDAGAVFSKVKPRLAVFSHLLLFSTDPKISPPTAADVLQEARKTYPGPLEVG